MDVQILPGIMSACLAGINSREAHFNPRMGWWWWILGFGLGNAERSKVHHHPERLVRIIHRNAIDPRGEVIHLPIQEQLEGIPCSRGYQVRRPLRSCHRCPLFILGRVGDEGAALSPRPITKIPPCMVSNRYTMGKRP